jgi:gluconolactonase
MFAALVVSIALGADSLVAGPIETVGDGFQFTEGPVWTKDGLLFTDIPADTIYRTDKSVAFKPSGKTNGLTIDGEGKLIRCEHWNRRVTRVETDGAITVLADEFGGKKFNSPNDAVWHTSGTVFFTDPTYGLEGRPQEQPGQSVYAIRPGGEVVQVAGDFRQPNGIALSPDGKTLYVADTNGAHIRAFAIAADDSTSGGAELCKVPTPDGIRVDTDGRIWATSGRGVVVFDAAGKELEAIRFPQIPANCGFGGEDGRTLFVTARTAVYSVRTNATGLVGAWKR